MPKDPLNRPTGWPRKGGASNRFTDQTPHQTAQSPADNPLALVHSCLSSRFSLGCFGRLLTNLWGNRLSQYWKEIGYVLQPLGYTPFTGAPNTE